MRPLFIVNPAAGRGAALRKVPEIRAAMPGPADMVESGAPGDASRLAAEAARAGFGPVVAVGGDGTVMEIVHGVMGEVSPPTLGIVPVGGGNDFARSLGIPRDTADATRRVWSPACDPVDVGRCNDRWFLNVGGTGLDTEVARSLAGSQLAGTVGYLLHGIKVLSRYRNRELVIHLDDTVISARSLLVAVANGRSFAGGMKIAPGAEVDDGAFDVCVAGDLTRFEALTQIPMIYLGRHVRHPKVAVYRSRRVRIESPEGAAVQLDGEVVERLPAEFTLLPKALRIAGWSATD